MNRFFTLLFAASCLTAVGQVPDYVPDSVLIDEGWSLVLEREGQQYWLFDEDREWEDARAMCEELGAYLYWPNSLEEHLDVWNSVSQGSNDEIQYWTAIHQDFSQVVCDSDEGWAGPNGEPQTFFLWRSDEPTNGGNGESVVQFEWGTDGAEWNDAPGQFCDGESLCTCSFSRVIMERSGFPGCTNPTACNYNPEAMLDDGTCYDCDIPASHCGVGTVWDAEAQTCIVANPSDSNFDGCVQLNDLLDLLSAYGNCSVEESPWQCGDPIEYQGYDYETVQIGEQCWFAENLRIESYENGDAIPAGLNSSEWTSTTSGATVIYDGNASNLEAYGRLYNWHAVDDARSLCPSTWRIPSDGDWTILTDFLGGAAVAGGQMKTTYGWNGDGNGTNSSGFSGLPGGSFASNGNFNLGGSSGYWWSASPYGSSAWYRIVSYNDEAVTRNFAYQRNGYSVRCVRDAE